MQNLFSAVFDAPLSYYCLKVTALLFLGLESLLHADHHRKSLNTNIKIEHAFYAVPLCCKVLRLDIKMFLLAEIVTSLVRTRFNCVHPNNLHLN